MKKIILLPALVLWAVLADAQTTTPTSADSTVFRGTLVNDEYQVWLDIDFYSQAILVPDQELFGEIAGYLGARRDPRKWLITSAELTSPTTAQLEIINDYGSEDLTATLTLLPDGTFQLRQASGSTLRIVVNRKWLKLPKTLQFSRKKE
ncbi:MAG: hypothetical protein IJV36_03230 [Prevotella sp.]|nr:hypothetical protein [Prevotella sp.]